MPMLLHRLPLIDPSSFSVAPLTGKGDVHAILALSLRGEGGRRSDRSWVGCGCVVRGLARIVERRSAVVAERGSAEHGYKDECM
jgi:hypothetical protein